MRFSYLAFFGVLAATAISAVACGSGTGAHQTSAGSGGTGGGTVTATSTVMASTGSVVPDAGSDADNGQPSTIYPAPHPAPPTVINFGGSILAAPKLVPVFFANEDAVMKGKIEDFLGKLGATQYWAATTSEYGIGPTTAAASVVLTEAAPATIDDSAIRTWLADKLNKDDKAWPAADENTLYLLHYPSTTSITQQGSMGTESSCNNFGGYHGGITLDAMHGSMNVAYSVIPRCANFDNFHGIDAVTAAESHEIVEAATDAYPQANPAYGQIDDAHLYWTFALGGGELGDMCAQNLLNFTKFAELQYKVQRTWSNAAALAGHEPCVPALPGEVYFNAAPVLKDSVVFAGVGTMKGVKIPVGQTRTIDVDLFSDGDTGAPWDIEVQDFTKLTGGKPALDVSLDRNSGLNGEKLHLTITVLTASPYKAELFMLTSSLGQFTNTWVGLVGN